MIVLPNVVTETVSKTNSADRQDAQFDKPKGLMLYSPSRVSKGGGFFMRCTHNVVSVAAVLTLLGSVAPPAWAANLTGTWVGQQECRRFDGTKFFTPFPNDTMTISQTGADLNISSLGIRYHGQAIDDAAAPHVKAQASFVECTTTESSPYQEIGRATKIDIKSDGVRATFLATSIFFQDIDPFPADVGTCDWTYQRVSTADPGVEDCSSILTSATTNSTHSPKRR
jgi:hypothetical protein